MKVAAQKVYTITWDGTPRDYIRAANDLSLKRTGEGLDSLDCGDATGAILQWADAPDSGGGTEHDTCFLTFEGNMLAVSWDWDIFEYDLPSDETNISIKPEEL